MSSLHLQQSYFSLSILEVWTLCASEATWSLLKGTATKLQVNITYNETETKSGDKAKGREKVIDNRRKKIKLEETNSNKALHDWIS